MIPDTDKKRGVIRQALRDLESKNGRLTPEDVIMAARNPKSPLHGEFQWDKDKAAHAHWIEQARALIRSVRVVIIEDRREIATYHYVRDPAAEHDEQSYVSLERLRDEPENAKKMIIAEFSQAEAVLKRAENLADAVGLKKEVIPATRKVQAVRKKIEHLVTA